MAEATLPSTGYRGGATVRERAGAGTIAVALCVLLLWMLLRLGVLPPLGLRGPPALTTLTLKGEGAERARTVHKAPRKAGGAPKPAARTPVVHPQTSPSPVPSLNVLHVGHDDLAALDLAMATKHGDRGAGAAAGAEQDSASEDGSAGGGGQMGDSMAPVDWYRRPTHAEMATYLDSAHARAGWGEVVCKTAPRYHVEDCQELGESPGSGIARALREAAWQFQVLPPRRNGEPIIGAKVRIHFDVIEGFRG
jgi:protein TonB